MARFDPGDFLGSSSDFLFGTRPKSTISERPLQTPEQQALLKRLLEEFSAGGTLPEGGVTPFTGEQVAPLGELEGLSLEALEQKILQQVQGGRPGEEAETALSKMLQTGGAPVDFEQYFQTAIRDPAVQDFRETILPELTRRFGSSGAFGSDRVAAEQRATEGLNRTLTGARGELAFKTQSAAADRMIQALGLAPGIAGIEAGGVDSLLKLMQGAALPRSVEQARLTARYGEFQRQQEEKRKRVEQILAALGMKTTENIAQTTPGSTGFITPVAAAAAGKSGGGFFGG